MTPQIIDQQTYLALRGDAKVLEADSYGEKVLRCEDGTIIKLFRRKRLISSALWYPYANRFCDNAEALPRRGIAAPGIIKLMRIPEMQRDAVHYHPVPGLTLRDHFRRDPVPPDLPEIRAEIARFVASVFANGVLFRSLHLGNIVRLPDASFGLIDISDLRLRSSPLSGRMCRKSVERMLRISEPGEAKWVDAESILMAAHSAPRFFR